MKHLLAAFLVLFVSAALFAGGGAQAANGGIQFAPETLGLTPGSTTAEINLNWYSDTASGNVSRVRFVDAGGKLISAEGAVTPASDEKSAHKAVVKGLKPDTFYRYSVSNDGKNWSYEYNFKTPKAAAFRFAVIGDPQLTALHTNGNGAQDPASALFSADKTTAQGWKDTMAKVSAANVDFVAGVGDQVDVTNNGDEQEYRHFFAPPELRSIPWAAAVGNHDRHYPFRYHYNLPNEQAFEPLMGADYGNAGNQQRADSESYGNYWYRYNNALFVALNTSSYPESADAAAPVIKRFDDTLTAAKAASTGYTWLIVQHHKSTASVADHLADRDIQYYVEAGLEELMTTHNVDIVLSGHDHVYARSYPLQGRSGGTPSVPDTSQGGSTIDNPNGTIYLTVTTGSGLKYYGINDSTNNLYVRDNANYPYLVQGKAGSDAYKNENLMPASNAKYLQAFKPAFTVADVNGRSITFNTYNVDDTANSIDTFTVTK